MPDTPLTESIGSTKGVIPNTTSWNVTIEGPGGYRDTETFAVADPKAGRAAARKVMKAATTTFEKSDAGE